MLSSFLCLQPPDCHWRILFSSFAHFPSTLETLAEPPLPLDDFGPRALVQKIVNRHHALNSSDVCVRVALAKHGVVHLLWGWVLPIPVTATLGDRRFVSGRWKRVGLVGSRRLGDRMEHII